MTTPSDHLPAPGKRILLIGRSALVLEVIAGELKACGFDVDGTTTPDNAPKQFNAKDFDLIAIGGGVDAATNASIKAAFARQHPETYLLDAWAPAAVRQIIEVFSCESTAPRVDLAAYCKRIGYDGPLEPTLDVLKALHARHPDAIVFEAIDALLGRGIDISPAAVDAKLITARRGGYCFEQNSLCKRVLETIGFKVQGLGARVRWMMAPGSPPPGLTHMALRVTIDGVPWLADVGFGSAAQPAPLRMDVAEPQATAHERYRIFPFATWTAVQIEREGVWLPMYDLSPEPQFESDYQQGNWYTSTHPTSHFRNTLIVARTAPEARYTLLENRFTVRPRRGPIEQRFLNVDEIERTLVETFGLPVEPEWRPMIEKAAAASF
jgi:N-hydroxyarylamine O-acetyltransferase